MSIDIKIPGTFVGGSGMVAPHGTGKANWGGRWLGSDVTGAVGSQITAWAPSVSSGFACPNFTRFTSWGYPTITEFQGHRGVAFAEAAMGQQQAGAPSPGAAWYGVAIVARIGATAVLGTIELLASLTNTNQYSGWGDGLIQWDASGAISFNTWGGAEVLTTTTLYAPGDAVSIVVGVTGGNKPILCVNGEVITGTTDVTHLAINAVALGNGGGNRLNGEVYEVTVWNDRISTTDAPLIWSAMQAAYAFL